MNKFSIVPSACILALVAAGCVSQPIPLAPPEADAQAKTFEVNPDVAHIYIYRNQTAPEDPEHVALNGKMLGKTGPRTFFMVDVPPGTYEIVSNSFWGYDSTITIDAKAGNNYFVWQQITGGRTTARLELRLADEATGRAGVLECRRVQTERLSRALERF